MWEDAAQGGPELISSLYYSANVYAARAISKVRHFVVFPRKS
jgi:hypothetical protein